MREVRMTIRQLTDEERSATEKGLKAQEKGLLFFKTEMEVMEFQRDISHPHSYEKQMKLLNSNIKLTQKEINTIEATIKVAKDQLNNGIKVKE